MKIILSRKGFDSSYGGSPSLVTPEGELISLPIPESAEGSSGLKYSELSSPSGQSYFDILQQVGAKVGQDARCHLDPDIREAVTARGPGWRPAFGQAGAAARHLHNLGVGSGDLFIFFGWFRRVLSYGGRWRYDPADPGHHTIFGYLQVGEMIRVSGKTDVPLWLADHPHADSRHRSLPNNTIYVGAPGLSFEPTLPGAETLKYGDDLVLTKPGLSRSRWQLPDFFRNLKITYHQASSWREDYFQAASRGQEFVIEPDEMVANWAKELILNNSFSGRGD